LILLFEVDFSKYMFMRRNPYATHSIEWIWPPCIS
jgi:sarcosine oxidase delta subunit